MRIFKYIDFHDWAEDESVSDESLMRAIIEIEQGLFEANLGGNLYKKRIARKGQGKSGGYRTLIALKHNDRAIFIYGFAKNDRENITDKERKIFQHLAQLYLNVSNNELKILLNIGELIEVE